MQIVVAEPNPVQRAELIAALLPLQTRIVAVGDGRDALDAMTAAPTDILLADVFLPGLDAFELMGKLQEQNLETTLITMAENLSDQRVGTMYLQMLCRLGAEFAVLKPVNDRRFPGLIQDIRHIQDARRHRQGCVEPLQALRRSLECGEVITARTIRGDLLSACGELDTTRALGRFPRQRSGALDR